MLNNDDVIKISEQIKTYSNETLQKPSSATNITAIRKNNEELALNILLTLKSLKILINNNNKKSSLNIITSLKEFNINDEKNCNSAQYKEEWKQAALILDRIFFYLFLIMMPLTMAVFFKTNFIEYIISSNNRIDSNVPNEC